MKRLLLIVLPLLLIVGCSSPEPINYETTLIDRDGVYYTKDTNKPYSGPVFSLDENGRNKIESILEDGKMISYKDFKWYENGQKWSEGIDVVLVGHYHQKTIIEKDSKMLIFLGDWLKHYAFTKFDGKEWTQFSWNE